ncbi:phosphatidylinositol-specific phospholipase C/glycerophosphodiester phosphodiesterase family protein [Planctomycetota bacterium]
MVYLLLCFVVLVCTKFLLMAPGRVSASDTGIIPLSHAHAHNDYRHDRPLLDALAHGFCSVEADIFLVDGDLFVAHDREEIRPHRTLRGLYLDPLRKRIKQNGGRVYPNGPEFTLLIDFKTEAVSTYKALDKILAEYRDIFTSFDSEGRRGKAVLAIISGNRPLALMKSQEVRYASCDGRLTDLKSDAPASLIPMISDHWGRHFTWKGSGPMPAEERLKLREIVQTAHKKGRRVRFWATPDRPSPAREALWRELLAAGVDLLNTDDLMGLRQFLQAN